MVLEVLEVVLKVLEVFLEVFSISRNFSQESITIVDEMN